MWGAGEGEGGGGVAAVSEMVDLHPPYQQCKMQGLWLRGSRGGRGKKMGGGGLGRPIKRTEEHLQKLLSMSSPTTLSRCQTWVIDMFLFGGGGGCC